MKHLFYLNKYFYKYRIRLGLGIIFVSLSNYFGVLIPQQIRIALDFVQVEIQNVKLGNGVSDSELGTQLLIFAGIVVGFSILKGIFMYFMRQTIIVMSRLIEYDLRKEIFGHMEMMDLAYFKRNKTGDFMSRISEDVSKVRMYVGPATLYGINLVTLFALTIYSMFQVSVTLSLYTLIPLPILSLSIYYVSSKINFRSSLIQKQMAALTSAAQEVYSGIRVIKSYVKEDQFATYFEKESEEFKAKSLDLARINALFFPVMILLISASTVIVIYAGGLEVAKGNITTGNIAEFIIYVNMLTWPVTSIGWIASLIQQAEASQQRINELLNEKSELNRAGDLVDSLGGDIQFKDVSFVYPDTGIEALKNVSFHIKPGEKLAIIGKTASGKSTIADLILRMYDTTQGEIILDGKNIKEHNLDNVRRKIGYVPQDVFLFSDSVTNNIGFGSGEIEQEEAEKYAEYASIHDEINGLPEGYQTMMGERGVTLSGGQKQRISIARAFIKDPDIVILDDCLSAVDTDTEQKIMKYLNEALENKTSIIITHRIHNLLSFDKILVLDDGKISEMGTHDELIEKGGYYKEMLEQQNIGEEVE
ncbi:MAG: ABC transporter ATP-binding protein [Saprospiraceae bacterium]|nr:ABC transporter ATP-binding protein [Saprospiraceae bacterium]